MKAEKIAVDPNPVVATITVNQKELDLLTALINECNTSSKGVEVYEIYNVLWSAGGRTSGVVLEKTAKHDYEATFTVT